MKTWRRGLTDEDWLRLLGRTDPLIVEVGCNDGTDTRKFLDTFPECRIICFECDRRAIAMFKRNINDPRVQLVEAAAADRNGFTPWFASHGEVPKTAICHVAPESLLDWEKSGSIRRPTGHTIEPGWCTFAEEGSVQTVTLDSCLQPERFPRSAGVDLLWLDVQGAEADVIKGAWKTLARTRYLYTEFYDREFRQQNADLPELYEGAPGLAEIIGLVWQASQWDLRGFFDGGNVLLERRQEALRE